MVLHITTMSSPAVELGACQPLDALEAIRKRHLCPGAPSRLTVTACWSVGDAPEIGGHLPQNTDLSYPETPGFPRSCEAEWGLRMCRNCRQPYPYPHSANTPASTESLIEHGWLGRLQGRVRDSIAVPCANQTASWAFVCSNCLACASKPDNSTCAGSGLSLSCVISAARVPRQG